MLIRPARPFPPSQLRTSDPDDVHVRLRVFNDTNDLAEVEAYGSGDGLHYDPLGVATASPHTPATAYKQFDPINEPRHAMVQATINGVHIGPVHFHSPQDPVNFYTLDVALYYDPAYPAIRMRVGAYDEDGNMFETVEYAPPF